MIDNTILTGDADTLYQFLTEDIYSPEDLDGAEFLHKAALVGHTECVRVLLEHDLQVSPAEWNEETVWDTAAHINIWFSNLFPCGKIMFSIM